MKAYAITVNVAIIVLIAVVIFITSDPLALLGLFFLQQVHFSEPEPQVDIEQAVADALGGQDAEYNEHGSGFTAKI
jgi:hypothetical protein